LGTGTVVVGRVVDAERVSPSRLTGLLLETLDRVAEFWGFEAFSSTKIIAVMSMARVSTDIPQLIYLPRNLTNAPWAQVGEEEDVPRRRPRLVPLFEPLKRD
jgi:hypothetical protein